MSATEEVVDATVVDEPVQPAPSVQLARRERRSEVLRPLDTDQIAESFHAYQELCKRLLTPDDYQAADGKKFKKKSAWRKLATAFDLDVQLLRCDVERDESGQPVRATTIARAIAPSGRFQDADGYCSIDESRFQKTKGRQKLENDLRATATTRAKNRAISDLLGTGEVSAEEVDGGGGESSGPPLGPECDKELLPVASAAAVTLSVGNTEHAGMLWARVKKACGGYMPRAAALALIEAAEPANEPEVPEV